MPGDTALPASFIGVVIDKDIWGWLGPGQPIKSIVAGAPESPVDNELFDYLDAHGVGSEGGIPVVWFFDERVVLESVGAALSTGSRLGITEFWLASGSPEQPTMRAVSGGFGSCRSNGIPKRYVADLRLDLGSFSVIPFAQPRAAGFPPGEAGLEGGIAPPGALIRLTAPGRCHWPADDTMREIGRAMCDLTDGPYTLTLQVDGALHYRRLIERLSVDPRPKRCVAGPPAISLGGFGPQPSCDDAVTVRDLPAHFAARTQALLDDSRGTELDRYGDR
ncbi:MAG: hypothetical protein JKY37_21645 [Nannocystaceae bacterium]|nr:hypothetical protein [Nannocystaceae bacterium]